MIYGVHVACNATATTISSSTVRAVIRWRLLVHDEAAVLAKTVLAEVEHHQHNGQHDAQHGAVRLIACA